MDISKTAILCVDDEDLPRTLRKVILQKQDYEVVTASTGKKALAILSTRHFDLVLTDQIMPGMMGTELTRQIKYTMPHMPVVIISGVIELPPEASIADRFISKIEGPEALFNGIAEVLRSYRNTEGSTGNGWIASENGHLQSP